MKCDPEKLPPNLPPEVRRWLTLQMGRSGLAIIAVAKRPQKDYEPERAKCTFRPWIGLGLNFKF
jgi:hypothetical protein